MNNFKTKFLLDEKYSNNIKPGLINKSNIY